MTNANRDRPPTLREIRARRAAFVLTALLGVTWAVVIASRYPDLVPV